ncbi:MAG: FixH family protein [Comamonadaceae bacterium]|nr:FixH family protein [Pseudomonadota bacterium]MBS0611231.1 FixH family protein [Pseudomonadota bacterium]MDE2414480.1 FixH family protein [Comamonadaceae bacterium]
MSADSSMKAAPESQPWWKYGHVWLVITGPVIVVIASFVTLWLALSRPDPVLAEDYYQRGLDINKTLKSADSGMTPAIKGRNHAATPVQDQPR